MGILSTLVGVCIAGFVVNGEKPTKFWDHTSIIVGGKWESWVRLNSKNKDESDIISKKDSDVKVTVHCDSIQIKASKKLDQIHYVLEGENALKTFKAKESGVTDCKTEIDGKPFASLDITLYTTGLSPRERVSSQNSRTFTVDVVNDADKSKEYGIGLEYYADEDEKIQLKREYVTFVPDKFIVTDEHFEATASKYIQIKVKDKVVTIQVINTQNGLIKDNQFDLSIGLDVADGEVYAPIYLTPKLHPLIWTAGKHKSWKKDNTGNFEREWNSVSDVDVERHNYLTIHDKIYTEIQFYMDGAYSKDLELDKVVSKMIAPKNKEEINADNKKTSMSFKCSGNKLTGRSNTPKSFGTFKSEEDPSTDIEKWSSYIELKIKKPVDAAVLVPFSIANYGKPENQFIFLRKDKVKGSPSELKLIAFDNNYAWGYDKTKDYGYLKINQTENMEQMAIDFPGKVMKGIETGKIIYKIADKNFKDRNAKLQEVNAYEDEKYGFYIFEESDKEKGFQIKKITINANPKEISNDKIETIQVYFPEDTSASALDIKIKVIPWDGIAKFWGGFVTLCVLMVGQVLSCVFMAKRNARLKQNDV